MTKNIINTLNAHLKISKKHMMMEVKEQLLILSTYLSQSATHRFTDNEVLGDVGGKEVNEHLL